jgi:protocatechuate 3,4-dioxygenase beta subunit
VVGAEYLAPVVPPGLIYDGVAQLSNSNASGTGALYSSQLHIVTAAHIVWNSASPTGAPSPATLVKFDLQRDGNNIPIPIMVPAGNSILADGYDPTDPLKGNDIAMLKLRDQVDSSRYLIAPYYNPTQRGFGFYSANDEVGKPITLVGYGKTGTGDTGNTNDQVERVSIQNPNGFFSLSFTNPNGVTSQTVPIPAAGLTADFLARALGGLDSFNMAPAGEPDDRYNNVSVNRVDDQTFDVRFIRALGSRPVADMVSSDALAAIVRTLWHGSATAGKHYGGNVIDALRLGTNQVAGDAPNQFLIDFDNGLQANNANAGSDLGTDDQGNLLDSFPSEGDSGSPALLWDSTRAYWTIAGVLSYGESPPTDVTNYVRWNNTANVPGPARDPDSSFGERASYTRASRFFDLDYSATGGQEWAKPITLDMNYQALGRDGLTENITISVTKIAIGQIQITVNDADCAAYSGVYYSGPASSLVIRGSNDNETVDIQGDVGIPVTVYGGGGDDTLFVDHFSQNQNNVFFDGGSGRNSLWVQDQETGGEKSFTITDDSVTRNDLNPVPTVTYSNVEVRQLYLGGNGANTYTVKGAETGASYIYGGNDWDSYRVLFDTDLNVFIGQVYLMGGPGSENVTFLDANSTVGRDYTLTNQWLDRVGVGRFYYSNFRSLTLNTTDFADNITIAGTAANTATYVNGAGGDDVFTVGVAGFNVLNPLLGDLSLNGGDGINFVRLNDQGQNAALEYDVTASSITRSDIGAISYARFDSIELNAGAGTNSIMVRNSAPGSEIQINAGAGDDTITVGGPGLLATLDGIQGTVTVDGQGGTNRITLVDSGAGAWQNYQVGEESVTRAGIATIYTYNYASRSIQGPALAAGPPLGNCFDILGNAPATALSIAGGSGDDLISFALAAPLQNAQITVDGEDGRDQVAVADGLVSTDQVELINTEDLEVTGGGFSPGGLTAGATFTVGADYQQTTGGTLYLELGGAGTNDSDQLIVDGSVTLGGQLVLNSLPDFSAGEFILINNVGSSPVVGTFDGVPEGTELSVGGVFFKITYVGGDGNDVTLRPVYDLGGLAWDDVNGNGQQDSGEAAMSNATVQLLDPNNNNAVLASTTTDASGHYLFSGWVGGSYNVKFVLPSGYHLTTQDVGSDNTDSDADPSTGMVTVTVPSSDNANTDAGMRRPGAITGWAFADANNNGIQDTGEGALSGVTMTLKDSQGNVVQSTTTAQDGSYGFANVAPGSYTVTAQQLTGYVFSPLHQGSDTTKDSDFNSSGLDPATITDALAIVHQDAGEVHTMSIGDFVWEDVNRNGLQDSGEPGLANVTTRLRDGLGNLLATCSTDSNGHYYYAGLVPGSYNVEFLLPTTYLFTLRQVGSNAAIDSNPDTVYGMASVTLNSGGSDNWTIDAGMYRLGTITGRAWLDSNHDGIQQSGESGVAGIVVKLFDQNNVLIAQTTTNSAGVYVFGNITPGTYYLQFSKPSNDVFSPQDRGTDDTKDSDVNVLGKTNLFTLTSNGTDSYLDAGMYAV